MDDRLEQEASLAPLLRAQLGLAVRTVRPGGAFVCKFFGGSHRATLAVLAAARAAFANCAIAKPRHSRRANSERYLVATGLREGADAAEVPAS